MRSSSSVMVLLLSVAGLGCGCPQGNLVVPVRDVSFYLQLQVAGASLTGHGSSPPDGEGIAFDRATIAVAGPDLGRVAPGDLLLYAMSPGCQTDPAGVSSCDRDIRVRLTIHHVTTGAASFDLDDSRAALEVSVAAPVVTEPCPPKNGVSAGECGVPTPAAPLVAYTGIQGQFSMAHLAEDCTDAIAACALTADGTFDVTATSAAGNSVQLASGTLAAADTFSYQDGRSCNQ